MNENKTKQAATNSDASGKTHKTEKPAKAAKAETNDKTGTIGSAAGIIKTVRTTLEYTADNREKLPPGCAGALGIMLCVAMRELPGSPKGALKSTLGSVAHILSASFLEQAFVSPTISAALANIICHATESGENAPGCADAKPCAKGHGSCSCGGACSCGRKFIGAIQADPELAAAGIETIELWEEGAGASDQDARNYITICSSARRAAELMKDADSLKGEANSLMELLKQGGAKDEETRKQILLRIANLLHNFADLKKKVDSLEKKKGPADRVPDWRDTASGADLCSASREHVSERKPDTTGHTPCAAEAVSSSALAQATQDGKTSVACDTDKAKKESSGKKVKVSKSKPVDGVAEISGYYTPEEAEKLISRIRDWINGCNRSHRLGDLMTSIETIFGLNDRQLGELLGVSDRLVCHVRHGRPSPFATARFAEVFGIEGGATASSDETVRS